MKIVLRKKSLTQFLQESRKTISLQMITDDPFFFVCVGGGGVETGTFEGIISTAGDGSCRSFSDIIGTQLVALLGSKPGKH